LHSTQPSFFNALSPTTAAGKDSAVDEASSTLDLGWIRSADRVRDGQGAHDHAGVIERVIEMEADSPEVDATNAGERETERTGFRHLQAPR
jgi:hypothetical protein